MFDPYMHVKYGFIFITKFMEERSSQCNSVSGDKTQDINNFSLAA